MLSDERRRALERAAYGETTSEEESASARRELERWAKTPGRAAGAPAAADPAEQEGAGDGEPDESGAREQPTANRRRRVVGIAAAALVVGLVAGGAVGAILRPGATASDAGASQSPSPTADSASTSRLAAGDPSVVASSREKLLAAEALLGRIATPDDSFPHVYQDGDQYVPSSARRVLTLGTGQRVWIARKAGERGGYCLLALPAGDEGNGTLGTFACTLPDVFVTGGVSLADGDYLVQWHGGRIDATFGTSGG